jgi:hypothetical protein
MHNQQSKQKKSTFVNKLDFWFTLFTLAWILAGAVYVYDIYQDRKLSFIAKDALPLYQTSDLENSAKLGVVPHAARVRVLRVLYIENRIAVQVKTPDGQTGWIVKPNNVNLK